MNHVYMAVARAMYLDSLLLRTNDGSNWFPVADELVSNGAMNSREPVDLRGFVGANAKSHVATSRGEKNVMTSHRSKRRAATFAGR